MSSILAPLGVTGLIFGGCCSNVFALEGIIRSEPASGLIITFFQFVLTSGAAYLLHSSSTTGQNALKTGQVPLSRWAFIALMFCGINLLNNWAFAFNISVPVHIILRSFGSVTTMLAGMLRGKRYSALQVLSVGLLTIGVLFSAWADSESKGKSMSLESTTPNSEFTIGLLILLAAQLLSAFMGAFVEDTYATYKASWTENMFYSHFLSLPLFLPLHRRLREQYAKLATTPPLKLSWQHQQQGGINNDSSLVQEWLPEVVQQAFENLPNGIFYLLINATTQLACISGVNLLSAKSSAVTVTIVLNIRKLVSFILSTLLFGHTLSPKMVMGSALVFGSGALYGWETSWRLPRERARLAQTNGSVRNKID